MKGTYTMTKAFKSLQEVKESRESGKQQVFNMVFALKAVESTPANTTARSHGELQTNILAMFNELKTPLAVNQVFAGLKAGGMEVTTKKVSDKLWLMAKSGVLKKGESKGMYELV